MPPSVRDEQQPPRWTQWLLAAIALALAVLVIRGMVFARTYPQVHDAAIMRYVTFMIGSGHAPYTEMVEMNPPGTLMTEWFSLHVFGDGAAGLWRWDTAIGMVAVATAAWVGGAGYRWAGIAGALLAWLLHQADGARDLAQRDWFLAALLLLAAGCTAASLRKAQPLWMLPALALAGWAVAIKPFALLFALVLLGVVSLRMNKKQRWAALWSSCLGAAVPAVAVALYFHHWPGSFAAFLATERTVGAWYAQLDRAPLVSMVTQVLPVALFFVFLLSTYLALREKVSIYSGDLVLFAGFLCAAAMYLLQRKGFMYQTYPMDMFGSVGAMVVAQRALMLQRSQRLVATVLLMAALATLPLDLARKQRTALYPAAPQQALIADLQHLGGNQLQGRVQCLDMTLGGCIGALAALHLQQSTGFVNDHTLFPYEQQPFLTALQKRFLQQMAAAPPRVIVLSNHNWPNEQDRTYSSLERWPQFASFLAEHYRLEHTWQPPLPSGVGYRMYLLR